MNDTYKIFSLETGRFALDGGAMFGIVPKTIWSKYIPSDEQNRIELAMRVMLIQGSKRNILVDTGIGDKFPEKYQKIYKIDRSSATLTDSLKAHGLSPEDITDVIITHLHFDHAGGGTKFVDGKAVPVFPNAKYFIQKRNLQHAKNEDIKDAVSYMPENFQPMLDSGQMVLLNGETEIYPGIWVLEINGHTVGQQMVKVVAGEDTVIYCADLIPTTSHIHLPFIMGYDLYPVNTLNEKKAILKAALENNWILFFEHDPSIDACTIECSEGKYRKKEELSFRK